VFSGQDNKGNKGNKGDKGKGRARAERERGLVWYQLVLQTVHGPVFRVMWDGWVWVTAIAQLLGALIVRFYVQA
jgi:hypothetical protein